MLRRSKSLVAAAVVAAGLVGAAPAGPASASAAIGPCQVRPLVGVQEWYQEVLVTGYAAPRGAIDVDLTCGVVRDDETVAYSPDLLVGPVSAVAEVESVHAGQVSPCYILSVTYIDHSTYTNTCR